MSTTTKSLAMGKRIAELEAAVEMYKNTLRDILVIDDEVYDVYDCIRWAKKALQGVKDE